MWNKVSSMTITRPYIGNMNKTIRQYEL